MPVLSQLFKNRLRVFWTKKSDVVEIDVISNNINDTHEVHEVSITREAQEGEQLLGRTDLDAMKKGISHVTKKRGREPYRKYTDQDRAQTGNYCNIDGTTARVRKSVSTLPNLNKRGLFSWGCYFKRSRISNCWNTNQAVLRIEAWSHWSAKSLLESKLVASNGFQKTCC